MILPPFLLSYTRAFPGRQIQLLFALSPLWDEFLLTASLLGQFLHLFIYLFILGDWEKGERKCVWWHKEQSIKPVLLSMIGFGIGFCLTRES